MNNYTTISTYINALTYAEFKNINNYYQLEIEEEQLQVIYKIIKNNVYALANDSYHEVLYNYIQKKTNASTCLKVKKLISEYHFYFNPLLNV